ncbi:MAG: helix-turn-helix domain-containing protein, partial [Acidobacteriota bacterium]
DAAIGDERFRAPLLYRLSGFVLRLPPLRDRREDFGRLVLHFLERELDALGEVFRLAPTDKPWFPAALVARLARHPWPGNVRQLQNTVRQLVIANRGHDHVSDLGPVDELLADLSAAPSSSTKPEASTDTPQTPASRRRSRRPADIREDELVDALERHHYRIQATADFLGIPRGSLYELIEKSPRVRKASEIGADEIRGAITSHDGSVQAAAVELRVSEQALRRRMGQLDLG